MIDISAKNILVVEDDIITAALEMQQLEKEGYAVVHSLSGEEAIDLVCTDKNHIDLILMDIDLGCGLNGAEAATEILKNRNIPIVFLSSHTEKEVVQKTEKITSYGYVVKNSGITILDASIKMAFKLFNANLDLINKDNQLREREEQYRMLYHQAGLAIYYYKPDGTIISFNEIALKHGRLRAEDIEGKSIYDIYPAAHAKAFVSRFDKTITSEGHDEYEDCVPVEGGRRWYSSFFSKILDAKGCVTGIQVISRDITEKKLTEYALIEKEAFLSSIVENIPDMLFIKDATTLKYIQVNKAGGEYLGYKAEDLIGKTDYDIVPAEQADSFSETDRDVLNKGIPFEIPEEPIQTYSGSRMLHTKKIPLFNKEGNPAYLLGISQDVTEQKIAEDRIAFAKEELVRQKKALSVLNEIITIANHSENLSSLFNTILDKSLQLLDYDAGGVYLVDFDKQQAKIVCHKNIPDFFIGITDNISIFNTQYKDFFENGIPVITNHYENFSAENARRSGFRSLMSVPLQSKKRILGALNLISKRKYVADEEEKSTLIAIGREVGNLIERILAEESSRRNTANFETFFNTVDEMVFILDMEGNILRANDTALRRLNYSAAELVNRSILTLHSPDIRGEVETVLNGMIAGTTDICLYPLLTKDGMHIDVETKISRGLWDGEMGIFGVSRDISERKMTKMALSKSKVDMRYLQTAGHLGIWEFDRLSGNHIWSSEMFHLFGIDENNGVPPLEIFNKTIHPDDIAPVLAAHNRVFESGVSERVEYRYADGSDGWIFFEITIHAVKDDNQTITGLVGTTVDITERKNMEKSLRESVESFSKAFHSNPAAMLISDINTGKIFEVNDQWTKLIGYSKEEMIGHTSRELGFFIDWESRESVVQKMREKGSAKEEPLRLITKSGERRDVLWSVEIIFLGVRETMLSLVVDITERKSAEEKIKAPLSEKEIILKEVHHRIKNNLNTISSLLAMQANSLDNDTVRNILFDATGRVQSMKVLYDKLYNTDNIKEVNVKDYLCGLVTEVMGIFPDKEKVSLITEIDNLMLNTKIASPLGIIINEFITNSMKYAFSKKADPVIRVFLNQNDNGIRLIYEDNGIGLPVNYSFDSSSGFGLQLIGLLVRQINGTIQIERDGGTRFVLDFFPPRT